MRSVYLLAILFVSIMPSVGYSQIKPESSGDTSFGEPELRKHHHGLIDPNKPGRPRVGYHRHHRRYHNPHYAY